MALFRHWQSGLSLLILILTFFTIFHRTPRYNPEVIALYDVLGNFTREGQLAVELFPPLSLTISLSPDALSYLKIATKIAWTAVGVLFIGLRHVYDKLPSSLSGMAAIFILFSFCLFTSVGSEDIFSSLNEVADALLLTAILITIIYDRCPSWSRVLLFFGFGEAFILTSYALGTNFIDSLAAYALVFICRGSTLTRKIADRKCSPKSIILRGLSDLFIGLLVFPLSFILLHGAIIPASESSVAGNYNLRYLSAAARRDITQFPAIRSSLPGAPAFLPRHGVQYTLYVPGAGFLWSDSMMWKQSLPNTEQKFSGPDKKATKWSVESSYRVFFQDRFRERFTWEIQDLPRLPQSLRKHRKQWRISPGATVRLFDPIAFRYLCVIPGEAVISEAGYFSNDDEEEDLGRIRVGTNSNPISPHCEWTAYFDLRTDDGIRFYNDENQCTLASTFRSVPDSKLSLGNDTAGRVVGLKLEASCTKQASPASSKFFLIESPSLGKSANSKSSSVNEEGALAAVSYWRRGMHYFEARYRLARFRQYHSHLQEEALGTLINVIEGEMRSLDFSKPDITACVFYLAFWMLNLLARQRNPDIAGKAFQNGLPVSFHLGGLFVGCHVLSYYILGLKMLHSSRVAGMVSLYCLTDYVAQMT